MTNAFRMTIGADRAGVARVSAAFAKFAEQHALPASVRRSLHVALDELLTNAIVHGSAGEASVEVALGADQVSVTMTDDGPPFDPCGVPPPVIPNPDRIGGLGLPLVRRMMDEVSYERRSGRNVVLLTKRLSGGTSLDISTRQQNDVTIAAFAGSLDSATAPLAQQALDGILASGARKVVVDFAGLDYISSAGLRVLLGTAKRLGTGNLRLFGLNETVDEVFRISGFSTLLAVFATEKEALKQF